MNALARGRQLANKVLFEKDAKAEFIEGLNINIDIRKHGIELLQDLKSSG